jgi:hypothetical protein
MVVMALLLVGAMAGVSQLRLEEAAQAGARSLARGDDREIATQSIHRLAGPAAVVGITSSAGWVTVKVTANLEGPLALLFPWPLAASASARLEQPLGAGRRPELHTPQPRRAVVA